MKVRAYLSLDGEYEKILGGEAPVFDGDGSNVPLVNIGFWLERWYQASPQGRGHYHKGKVFIPWVSCLYVEAEDTLPQLGRK
jgi:hypothetical protein